LFINWLGILCPLFILMVLLTLNGPH
jgi:hypothetical protein